MGLRARLPGPNLKCVCVSVCVSWPNLNVFFFRHKNRQLENGWATETESVSYLVCLQFNLIWFWFFF